MKQISTLFAMLMLFMCGAMTASAQSKVPGVLDLSTTVVAAGTGTLHDGAGWDGSKIDWMTKGNTATIQFENTKDNAKFNIVSYGGTNQSQVVVNFKITDSNGAEVYNETTAPYASGGFGDSKKNASLPTTNAMAAGNYTLTLTYDNLEEGSSLEVNITKIEFEDADAQQGGNGGNGGVTPSADGSFTVDLSTVDTSESKAGNLHYMGEGDDNCPRLDYPAAGSIAKFVIDIPKASAYQISFNYASPMDNMFMIWSLTNASGEVPYSEYFPLDPTGAPLDFWTIYKDFTIANNTPVLAPGKYTLRLYYNVSTDGSITPAWYDGSENASFHANIKSITFTPVSGNTAKEKVVFLHGENFDKANSTNDLYQFTDAAGFTLTMNNRDISRTPCNWTDSNGNAYTDGINFKNNDPGTINIPEGYKVTKLEIGGCSQSDAGNLCYLFTVDKDDVNFFTEAIGQDVKENSDIQSKATYPIIADGTAPLFATLDFSAAPATKSIKVVFSGNNQEDVWFKVYYNDGSEQPAGSKTIYSWVSPDGTVVETGGKATGTDEARVNYSNAGYYTISINKNKGNVDTDYVLITLDEALQAGDVISITAYRNKDTNANGTLYMLFENGAEIDEGTEEVWNNIHPDYAQEPNTRTYTIGAEAGSKSFKINRSATGTNVFITKLEITRGGSTGIESVKKAGVKAESNVIYNLSGQRVDADYKGIVIKNGKKFVQK